MKKTAGFSHIELAILIGVLIITGTIAITSYVKYSTDPKTPETGVAQKDISDGATRERTLVPQKTSSPLKIAENESPRVDQDRFFYNVYYFSSTNKITLDFTITANDANREINGLSIDLSAQEPPLPTPINTSVTVNGGGVVNEWSCTITGTVFNCNGAANLEENVKSTFEFDFNRLDQCPEKLTINLLENGSVATTIIPLLQR